MLPRLYAQFAKLQFPHARVYVNAFATEITVTVSRKGLNAV